MDAELLGIYLKDHLAGSTAGLELARRIAGKNAGNAVGDTLSALAAEIEQDREVLQRLIQKVGKGRSQLKAGVAWLLERMGRLKLNGRLLSYSPLSRLMELELLSLGVQGKLRLWRVLARLARTERQLAGFDFEALAARAQEQVQVLDRLHQQAADTAFTRAPLPTGPHAPLKSGAR